MLTPRQIAQGILQGIRAAGGAATKRELLELVLASTPIAKSFDDCVAIGRGYIERALASVHGGESIEKRFVSEASIKSGKWKAKEGGATKKGAKGATLYDAVPVKSGAKAEPGDKQSVASGWQSHAASIGVPQDSISDFEGKIQDRNGVVIVGKKGVRFVEHGISQHVAGIRSVDDMVGSVKRGRGESVYPVHGYDKKKSRDLAKFEADSLTHGRWDSGNLSSDERNLLKKLVAEGRMTVRKGGADEHTANGVPDIYEPVQATKAGNQPAAKPSKKAEKAKDLVANDPGEISDYLDPSKYQTKEEYTQAEHARLKKILPDDNDETLRAQAEMWANDRWTPLPEKGKFEVGQTVSVGGQLGSYRGTFTHTDGKKYAVIAGGSSGQYSVPIEKVEIADFRLPDVDSRLPHQKTWEERRKDLLRGFMSGGRTKPTPGELRVMKKEHHDNVMMALAAGKPVPAEVLADYPDLKTGNQPVTKPSKKAEKKPVAEPVAGNQSGNQKDAAKSPKPAAKPVESKKLAIGDAESLINAHSNGQVKLDRDTFSAAVAKLPSDALMTVHRNILERGAASDAERRQQLIEHHFGKGAEAKKPSEMLPGDVAVKLQSGELSVDDMIDMPASVVRDVATHLGVPKEWQSGSPAEIRAYIRGAVQKRTKTPKVTVRKKTSKA